MPDTGIDAAAVGIKAANDQIVDADQRGQHAHCGDQPKRSVARNGERQADDVGFARAPVAVQNCGRALPIDIARSLNVGWYQLSRLKRGFARATRRLTSSGVGFTTSLAPLMMLTRLAVGLEPSNALDAA